MNDHKSPLYWSIPAGNWYGVPMRVSVYFPLLALVICFRLHDARVGLVFSVLLFVSVILHEFGHVVAARLSGGDADEILVWPLGGLTVAQPGLGRSAEISTPLGGPLVNLILCLITLPAVVFDSPYLGDALHPFRVPAVDLQGAVVSDLFVLLFCANWILLLVNLVPVYPLDGGQVLQAVLAERFGRDVGRESCLRIGCVIGFLAIFLGLLFDNAWVLVAGTVLLVWNIHEIYQLRAREAYEESFMGYDFSQGYTSLERSSQRISSPAPGFLQRWRARRRAEKLRRQQQKEQELEHQLDLLLEKVHGYGYDSLTDEEKKQLRRVSALYRRKEGRQKLP